MKKNKSILSVKIYYNGDVDIILDDNLNKRQLAGIIYLLHDIAYDLKDDILEGRFDDE